MRESGGNNFPYAHNNPFVSERDPYFNFIVRVVTIVVSRLCVAHVSSVLLARIDISLNFGKSVSFSFFYRRHTRLWTAFKSNYVPSEFVSIPYRLQILSSFNMTLQLQ